MSVIVFNRDTGKYLKDHRVSYPIFRRSTRWDLMLLNKMKGVTEKIIDEALFNASPETARKYSSITTAKQSVGIKKGTYIEGTVVTVIPDHLELHRMESKRVVLNVKPIVLKQARMKFTNKK